MPEKPKKQKPKKADKPEWEPRPYMVNFSAGEPLGLGFAPGGVLLVVKYPKDTEPKIEKRSMLVAVNATPVKTQTELAAALKDVRAGQNLAISFVTTPPPKLAAKASSSLFFAAAARVII